MAQFSKKEAARLERELKHLQQNFAGVENMTTLPDAMFVIDPNAEVIAVREARRMGIPVVAIVDTNCDPDLVDWVIPGNDDALRAIRLFTSKISDAVIAGRQSFEQSQIADQKAVEGGRRRGRGLRGHQRLRSLREAGRRFRRRRAGRIGRDRRSRGCSHTDRRRNSSAREVRRRHLWCEPPPALISFNGPAEPVISSEFVQRN